VLKDEFEHFWSYSYLGSAKAFLKRWMTSALRSRPPSMRVFVKSLRAHYDNIITYIERSLTNAVAEGLNRIVGDLDIPDKIPATLKAL
jgi:transposase